MSSQKKKIGRPPTGAAKTPAERMAAMRARKAAAKAAGVVTSKILDLSEVKAPKVTPPAHRPGVTGTTALHADRDVKKLFVGKEPAGSITRTAREITIKLQTAALSFEKEDRLEAFIKQLLMDPY